VQGTDTERSRAMTKIIQGVPFLVSAPFTLRIFLFESVFYKHCDNIFILIKINDIN